MSARSPYAEAYELKGVWASRRYFALRRLAQAAFLLVFLTGPWFGLWIAKGSLSSSRTLDVLPLTDPFVLLQSLFARHWPETTALIGAAIVLGAYLVVGGRTYCSWVCPINPIADLAAAVRRRFDIKQTAKLRPEFRNYFVVGILVLSFATGTVAWELVNPITALHRALVFGLPFAAAYASTKGGVVQMTRVLATAWAKDNIQANAILPGWIDTELTQNARRQVGGLHERVEDRTPAGRWGVPQDFAGVAVFLASPASDFVTGTAIPVDGGYSVMGG